MRASLLCLALSACGPVLAYQEFQPFQGGEIMVICSLPVERCVVMPRLVGWP